MTASPENVIRQPSRGIYVLILLLGMAFAVVFTTFGVLVNGVVLIIAVAEVYSVDTRLELSIAVDLLGEHHFVLLGVLI